ncbi:MAG: LacI family DNA-binding transcriptional regulator [Clostridiales bacterium]|nr:LacI family DNA-binding transcriptional regulator [Clostridiales bacterium]
MEERENLNKIYKIEDIARELGVSKTTVSRAISGKGRISKATTERVKEFIATHDYRPNAMARGLAQSKTYNLGVVLPVEYEAMEFAFFKDCLIGICQAAAECNYDIMLCMVNGKDLTQIERLVINRKVDGIILSRAVVSSSAQRYLKEKKVPFVVIGPNSDKSVVSVDNKNREACQELTSVLLMKGNKKLALIGGSETHRVTESRYQGFADAFKEAGRDIKEALVIMNADGFLDVSRAVRQVLDKGADCIVCMDDFICTQVIGCLRENRLRVPDDIRIASFYDNSQLEFDNPSVTSIRFDTKELGKKACYKLLHILGEVTEDKIRQPGYQVILRESTM